MIHRPLEPCSLSFRESDLNYRNALFPNLLDDRKPPIPRNLDSERPYRRVQKSHVIVYGRPEYDPQHLFATIAVLLQAFDPTGVEIADRV